MPPIAIYHGNPVTLLRTAANVGAHKAMLDAQKRNEDQLRADRDWAAKMAGINQTDQSLAETRRYHDLATRRGYDTQAAITGRQDAQHAFAADQNALKESERWRRLGEEYRLRGDLQNAQHLDDLAEIEARAEAAMERARFTQGQAGLRQEDAQAFTANRNLVKAEIDSQKRQGAEQVRTAKDARTKREGYAKFAEAEHRLAQQNVADHLRMKPKFQAGMRLSQYKAELARWASDLMALQEREAQGEEQVRQAMQSLAYGSIEDSLNDFFGGVRAPAPAESPQIPEPMGPPLPAGYTPPPAGPAPMGPPLPPGYTPMPSQTAGAPATTQPALSIGQIITNPAGRRGRIAGFQNGRPVIEPLE